MKIRAMIAAAAVAGLVAAPLGAASDDVPGGPSADAAGTMSGQSAGEGRFSPGWDVFDISYEGNASSVSWSAGGSGSLSVTFTLAGMQPSRLYQVGLHLFPADCVGAPRGFGNFPASPCVRLTREGRTAHASAVELGVVLTDGGGNGTVTLHLLGAPIGVHRLAFTVRDGAGCRVTGGGAACDVGLRYPGPFGEAVRVQID